jgi:hypothetical protein
VSRDARIFGVVGLWVASPRAVVAGGYSWSDRAYEVVGHDGLWASVCTFAPGYTLVRANPTGLADETSDMWARRTRGRSRRGGICDGGQRGRVGVCKHAHDREVERRVVGR